MSLLVESLKRLFNDGKISAMKIREMLKSGKITEEDYKYITGGGE